MFNIDKSNWYQEFEENTKGRDFIVGDLHGHYSLLMEALSKVSFDFERDRLFSVGDLVDRGPEVLECLNLIKEKWFFPVMGNHEYMLLSSLGQRMGLLNTIQSFLYSDRRKGKNIKLMEFIKLINEMPIVIKINHPEVPFYLTHAERPVKRNIVWSDETFDAKKNRPIKTKHCAKMLWDRKIPKQAMLLNNIPRHTVYSCPESWTLGPTEIIGRTPFEESSSITYCGHTIMNEVLFHRSHIFIDGGRYKGGTLRLIEHSKTVDLLKDYKGKGGITPLSCSI